MKRLLIIRLGALGDLVHLSGTLDAVKYLKPELELHLLTRPAYAQLAAMMPVVQHTWFWNPQAGWPSLWKTGKMLREAGIESVVNLHPSFKTWLLTQCIRPSAGQAVYHKQKLKQHGQAQRALSRRHAIEDFYQPFQKFLNLPEAADLPEGLLIPRLQQFNTASVFSSPYSSTMPTKEPGSIWIGLIPGVGGKRANRAWPLQAWNALSQNLLAKSSNVHIILLGGIDEKALATELLNSLQEASPASSTLAGISHIHNHCGYWDIAGTIELMRQCDIVVGGDTGPLHLAAGLGIPVIGVFGPTAPTRTGPRGSAFPQSILPPETLDCWPCEQASCLFFDERHLACMREISVETVEKAILQTLSF